MTHPTGAERITQCRICASKRLYTFLNLASMPIPNGFLTKAGLQKKEAVYPLKVCVCESCWLVQLTHVVSPDEMFRNYLYIPSTSTTLQSHFNSFSQDVIQEYHVKKKDLVVDIGSNDGLMLSYFKKKGMRILGIDPAENLAREANKNGIPTLNEFFSEALAIDIVRNHGEAKIVTATNVIAHIHDLHEVCRGIAKLIGDTGVFIMEAPYALDLMDRNEFDTIYHEHLSYFSIRPLKHLFSEFGLRIIDVQKQPIHGGSIRVFVTKENNEHSVHPRVNKILIEEELKKMQRRDTYDEFARRVKVMKRDVKAFFKRITKSGRRVVGYGAAAKGNVLMNYMGITSDTFDYVVDSISYKQGKYTPGTHIPIFPESYLLEDMPDYAFILSWNFADEIIEKHTKYRENGGQFIVAVPYLRII